MLCLLIFLALRQLTALAGRDFVEPDGRARPLPLLRFSTEIAIIPPPVGAFLLSDTGDVRRQDAVACALVFWSGHRFDADRGPLLLLSLGIHAQQATST